MATRADPFPSHIQARTHVEAGAGLDMPARAGERPPAARSGAGRGIAAWVRRKPAHAFALAVAAGWLLGKISRVAQGRRPR
ncbi:hypothetical protein SAMN04487939_103216 [Lysobacter sp. yr284]|uniref:hypothetical protein n=1 Tax=Lysobacter sp. yr284 TaxID=1761791 RepID=UPI0008994D39|nr:hypothetical protein [Lysobacter sp. yr284]SDY56595.1 hypothetical protein SAMN04487939_103216 [Lysobacter sp. yr284]